MNTHVDKEMSRSALSHRLAAERDTGALQTLVDAAIGSLQAPFLNPQQIESSRTIMGVDTQLIQDRTYFVIEADGIIVGCGGWSRRATLYGGDQTPGRSAVLLDPARDAARVRAMYTHPVYVRRGIGRMILSLCEGAAKAEGFSRVELMATLSGEPLYLACGYEPMEKIQDDRGGVPVPLIRMQKILQTPDDT